MEKATVKIANEMLKDIREATNGGVEDVLCGKCNTERLNRLVSLLDWNFVRLCNRSRKLKNVVCEAKKELARLSEAIGKQIERESDETRRGELYSLFDILHSVYVRLGN